MKLMAVDPSLTCSGWALFSVPQADRSRERLLAVGKIKSLGPETALATRYLDLQEKIASILAAVELGAGDILVCEAPTTMRDPRAAFKVEQVRGIFETLARERGVSVPGRINPRTVQSEVMGLRGSQLRRAEVKDTAVIIVERLFADSLKELGFDVRRASLKRHQDIVDAILVGVTAVTRVRSGIRALIDLNACFALPPRKASRRLPR
ncbi:MAG: hypothetical protein K1X79_06440 [Oligoflexia bacterium]|nr:hypothetical protein [Oligoflexia bacterium]